jgi:hypothetical protein
MLRYIFGKVEFHTGAHTMTDLGYVPHAPHERGIVAPPIDSWQARGFSKVQAGQDIPGADEGYVPDDPRANVKTSSGEIASQGATGTGVDIWNPGGTGLAKDFDQTNIDRMGPDWLYKSQETGTLGMEHKEDILPGAYHVSGPDSLRDTRGWSETVDAFGVKKPSPDWSPTSGYTTKGVGSGTDVAWQNVIADDVSRIEGGFASKGAADIKGEPGKDKYGMPSPTVAPPVDTNISTTSVNQSMPKTNLATGDVDFAERSTPSFFGAKAYDFDTAASNKLKTPGAIDASMGGGDKVAGAAQGHTVVDSSGFEEGDEFFHYGKTAAAPIDGAGATGIHGVYSADDKDTVLEVPESPAAVPGDKPAVGSAPPAPAPDADAAAADGKETVTGPNMHSHDDYTSHSKDILHGDEAAAAKAKAAAAGDGDDVDAGADDDDAVPGADIPGRPAGTHYHGDEFGWHVAEQPHAKKPLPAGVDWWDDHEHKNYDSPQGKYLRDISGVMEGWGIDMASPEFAESIQDWRQDSLAMESGGDFKSSQGFGRRVANIFGDKDGVPWSDPSMQAPFENSWNDFVQNRWRTGNPETSMYTASLGLGTNLRAMLATKNDAVPRTYDAALGEKLKGQLRDWVAGSSDTGPGGMQGRAGRDRDANSFTTEQRQELAYIHLKSMGIPDGYIREYLGDPDVLGDIRNAQKAMTNMGYEFSGSIEDGTAEMLYKNNAGIKWESTAAGPTVVEADTAAGVSTAKEIPFDDDEIDTYGKTLRTAIMGANPGGLSDRDNRAALLEALSAPLKLPDGWTFDEEKKQLVSSGFTRQEKKEKIDGELVGTGEWELVPTVPIELTPEIKAAWESAYSLKEWGLQAYQDATKSTLATDVYLAGQEAQGIGFDPEGYYGEARTAERRAGGGMGWAGTAGMPGRLPGAPEDTWQMSVPSGPYATAPDAGAGAPPPSGDGPSIEGYTPDRWGAPETLGADQIQPEVPERAQIESKNLTERYMTNTNNGIREALDTGSYISLENALMVPLPPPPAGMSWDGTKFIQSEGFEGRPISSSVQEWRAANGMAYAMRDRGLQVLDAIRGMEMEELKIDSEYQENEHRFLSAMGADGSDTDIDSAEELMWRNAKLENDKLVADGKRNNWNTALNLIMNPTALMLANEHGLLAQIDTDLGTSLASTIPRVAPGSIPTFEEYSGMDGTAQAAAFLSWQRNNPGMGLEAFLKMVHQTAPGVASTVQYGVGPGAATGALR